MFSVESYIDLLLTKGEISPEQSKLLKRMECSKELEISSVKDVYECISFPVQRMWTWDKCNLCKRLVFATNKYVCRLALFCWRDCWDTDAISEWSLAAGGCRIYWTSIQDWAVQARWRNIISTARINARAVTVVRWLLEIEEPTQDLQEDYTDTHGRMVETAAEKNCEPYETCEVLVLERGYCRAGQAGWRKDEEVRDMDVVNRDYRIDTTVDEHSIYIGRWEVVSNVFDERAWIFEPLLHYASSGW